MKKTSVLLLALLLTLMPGAALADTSEEWFTQIYEAYSEMAGDELSPAPTAAPVRTAVPPSFGGRDPVSAQVRGRELATGAVLQEGGFEFVVSTQQGYAVITRYTGAAETVAVPPSLGGYTVAYIGDGAFSNCYGISALTLPDTVTQLGHSVFLACVNLEAVTLPVGITDVGVSLFTYCKALMGLILPPELPVISVGMFQQCASLEKLVIPGRVTMIDELAFHNCLSLREVSVPQAVKQIADNAFSNCPKLTLLVYEGSYALGYALTHGIPVRIIR